jgi:ATP-dependent DNA helicase DinG
MNEEIGEDAAGRITDSAARTMAHAIAETGGREVFFVGTLNSEGLVTDVKARARGTEGAVPAIFEGLNRGQVVIHNHPGGHIEPSEADLELAVGYSTNGHGVYIVDNEVLRVYVVVEPFRDTQREKLNLAKLDRFFQPDGPLGRALTDYEVRPQQSAMMRSVSRALNEDTIAVIEAPTGVGKTLAYLLPAALWAIRNRERVVISTRTINLQEQIVLKDIPLLQRCLDEKFTAVLVKGRQNYICPRRLQRAFSEASLFDDPETEAMLKSLAEWVKTTKDGSRSDLSFVPPRDVWERVCSEADTCTMAQCQAAGDCFVPKARREIAKADLVVVNHHMLFSDLAIKKDVENFSTLAVLPAYDRLILDEAHHVEDSATEYFGQEATRNGALALLGRFIRRERGQERGLIPYVRVKLAQEALSLSLAEHDTLIDLIENSLLTAIAASREAVEVAFKAMRELTAAKSGQIGRDVKWRLTEKVLADGALRELHQVYVLPAVEELSRLVKHCSILLTKLQGIAPAPEQTEKPLLVEAAQLEGYRDRLNRLANVLAEGTSAALEENTVRWIEIDAQNENIVRIVRCPLEVGKPLAEWVYPNLKTVVMTSATLTVRQDFDFLFSRIGLDTNEGAKENSLSLDSPFDFNRQAILCVTEDVVPPNHSDFMAMTTDYIDEAIEATGGHAFVLFTSFRALNYTYNRLEEGLRAKGITPLKQGGQNRTHLLERFRRDSRSCLFATDSFWEGVDVAGDALQCVILPRLPFRVPTEPILQARAEAIEARGGNAFMDYTVPLAVIKFRQGFGRLVRRRTDRGSILVLDSRILTKYYGKLFLESLPEIRVVKGARKEVFAAFRKFHADEEEGYQSP